MSRKTFPGALSSSGGIRRGARRAGARATPAAGPPPDPLDYVTPEGIADLLKLEVATVRDLLAAKKLPGLKLNGKWRTRRSDLERHMAHLAAQGRAENEAPNPNGVAAQLLRDMAAPKKAG